MEPVEFHAQLQGADLGVCRLQRDADNAGQRRGEGFSGDRSTFGSQVARL